MTNPRRCPICKTTLTQSEAGQKFRPFCSRRCADIDLGHWLKGSYVIPGKPDATEDEEEGGTPNEDPPVRH